MSATATRSAQHGTPSAHPPFIIDEHDSCGFMKVANIIYDRYAAVLGGLGFAVLVALTRYADRNGVCFPSQKTLAEKLGMSRRQVNREIAKLERLGLIEVAPRFDATGAHRSNLYVINRYRVQGEPEQQPSPANPAHSPTPAYDPPCNPPVHPPLSARHRGYDRESHPPMTDSHPPYDSPLHKQYPANHTHKEQDPEEEQQHTRAHHENAVAGDAQPDVVVASSSPPLADDPDRSMDAPQPETIGAETQTPPASGHNHPTPLSPPSPSDERRQDAAAALIAIGIAKHTAQTLAARYEVARIAEKIEYLAFLQAEQPEQVKNPCGWLRCAIAHDYAAPDGFLSQEERERRAQAAAQRAQEEEECARIAAEQTQAAQAQRAAHQEALRQQLQDRYDTTAEDRAFWTAAQQDFTQFNYTGQQRIYIILRAAEVLKVRPDSALIGIQQKADFRLLHHPGARIAITRVLSGVAGRTLAPAFVLLE